MRAAILSHNACEGDAIGQQVAARVSFLSARGWEVRLFVESEARLHPALGPCCTKGSAARRWRDPATRRYLLEADLIFAEYGQSYGLIDLLPALADSSARIVVDYYGVTPPEFADSGLRRRLEESQRQRGLVWCADAVLVPSRFAAMELHQAIGYPLDRIHQLPCSLDVESFSPRPLLRDVRGPLGLVDARVLLFVGRLAANKHVPVLIEAAARLRELVPPVHAVIIGDAGDVYAEEARRCLLLTERLDMADRVHWLSRVDEDTLRDWYRAADVLVIPSRHESFCLPVVEAMASGLPVVAARAAALPETLGDAGLSFQPEDADDLARQLRRVLHPSPLGGGSGWGERLRVAVVAPRYGPGFAGGAETSLRTIATALHQTGHQVEVFTTCNQHESRWDNHLPDGTHDVDGIPVHRHPIDRHDRDRHLASLETVRLKVGQLSEAQELEYLKHSLHSTQLLEALEQRRHDFDAIVVGPYLFGLTWAIARRFAERVLLLPCFHDEPLARFATLQRTYQNVAGVLYHSEEEQRFAETELGLNHPYASVIGTVIQSETGDPARGRERCGPCYVVYCGRYSPEKGVDRLLDFARRYVPKHPDRYRFVFMGQQGGLPDEAWLLNLGYVSEEVKRDAIAGARALIQLSTQESLSLVALEAWAAGVPVIGHRDCAAIRAQIARAGGGRAVGDAQEFAAALDDLWNHSDTWKQMGDAGRRYVQEHYQSLPDFTRRLTDSIQSVRTPLAEQMRKRGLRRAERFSSQVWEDRLDGILTPLIERPGQPKSARLEIVPQIEQQRVAVSSTSVLVPVRITNHGTGPATGQGPAAVELSYLIGDEQDLLVQAEPLRTRLPVLIAPGQSVVSVVAIAVPSSPGTYRIAFTAESRGGEPLTPQLADAALTLIVGAEETNSGTGVSEPFVATAQKLLAGAHGLKTLPDDYQDVTEGFLASWKRRLKRKLLNNFKKAYVDVLSRQQSAFNERVVVALSQLTDCCSVLGQAIGNGNEDAQLQALLRKVLRRQRLILRRQRAIEEKLVALGSEGRLSGRAGVQ